jgi:hypothetical protein
LEATHFRLPHLIVTNGSNQQKHPEEGKIMKTGSFLVILVAVFLIGSSGIASAGGMHWSGAGKHEMAKNAAVNPPVMVSTEYLEYLEIENGLETGSLTAPGVNATEIEGPSTRVVIPEGG